MEISTFVISEPFLCVAALLEMVVRNELEIEISQSDIAEYFGVYVPEDYKGNIKNIKRTEETNMLGIVIEGDHVNDFFRANNLELKEEYKSIKCFTDWSFEDELLKVKENNTYLICGFDYGHLFKKSANSVGHVCLILDIDVNNQSIVKIYDPGPEENGIKYVKAVDLFYAMHSKNNGIWEISPSAN